LACCRTRSTRARWAAAMDLVRTGGGRPRENWRWTSRDRCDHASRRRIFFAGRVSPLRRWRIFTRLNAGRWAWAWPTVSQRNDGARAARFEMAVEYSRLTVSGSVAKLGVFRDVHGWKTVSRPRNLTGLFGGCARGARPSNLPRGGGSGWKPRKRWLPQWRCLRPAILPRWGRISFFKGSRRAV